MTESEAIKYFRLATDEAGHEEFSDVYKEMCGMAIQALTEVQAYRAIGTVEELKAIKQWKSDIIESFSKYDVNSVDELMKRFRELTEKAEPKKPKSRDFYSGYKCGSCGTNIPYQNQKYCCDCGTAIDWE